MSKIFIVQNKNRSVQSENGFVLIASLVFLLVLTIFSVSMFRNFGLQEKIAGNIREKQRAFHSAQSALQFGEWFLTQGKANSGSLCSTLLDANAGETIVCSNELTDPTDVPWKNGSVDIGITYVPPTTPPMAISTIGGLNTYFDVPRFYIFYLGLDSTGQSTLYQVTAMGFGGSSNGIAVVQSTYAVSTGIKDLGGL
ncbi:MAG: PilX N-terminal domain-containing pilus assembly protein [Pseudomonadota bacterium]